MLQTILFAELLKYTECDLTKESLANLEYFQKAAFFLSKKNINSCINKLQTKIKNIKVKKGTLIYNHSDNADACYFMISGKVELLNKKTSKEKTQTYPNHTLFSTLEKINYLKETFGFQPKTAEKLIDLFYEEKIIFKYLPYRQISSSGEFGIGQLVRNSLRPLTAIATADTELIVITKDVFDECIRDFQIRKESVYIQKILLSLGKDSAERLKGKIGQIMNLGAVRILDKGQMLYTQGNDCKFMYLLFQGEVEMRKKINLQIPKKFIQTENKKIGKKQVQVKVCKIGEGSFLGQSQILRYEKNRLFSVVCTINQTILLQIQPQSFLKVLSDYGDGQKAFILNANSKLSTSLQNLQKQRHNLNKAFLKQYEEFETKNQQNVLQNQLHDKPDVKKQFFEVFTSDGLFYRDTFEKIQGFDFDDPPRSKSIKMTRMKDIHNQSMSPEFIRNAKNQNIKLEEKTLFSGKFQLSQADFLCKTIINNQMPSRSLTKKAKSQHKFEGIKKDQQIFKKVMIKHGLYYKDRAIDRSRIARPIINYKFDNVIQQCISRKNPIIRKVINEQKKTEMIKQSYQNTVKTLRKQSSAQTRFTNSSTPCLGVQQMKKRMEQYKNMKPFSKTNASETFQPNPQLEECIGVNESPKSRDVRYRSNLRNTIKTYEAPPKIVLLNHMMKPMTYTSVQIHW